MLQARWEKYTLHFKFLARTSREEMRTKDTWLLYLTDDKGRTGTGECSMLRGLSPDPPHLFESRLNSLCDAINRGKEIPSLLSFPAIRSGYEMAMLDLRNGGQKRWFESVFTRGEKGILINGLVWMNDYQSMLKQAQEKIAQGYRIIKLKIGALDFDSELELIKMIRKQFSAPEIQICVDANGAFSLQEVESKLERLARYDLHSIEQPIRAGQWEEMRRLCQTTPIPIALDEELIGIFSKERKAALLDFIQPQYIILKPSLLGGFAASQEWIDLANERNTGWWVTSLLESNIGLNAIAQWTATLDLQGHQGLGTGQLYENNFDSPLFIEKGSLYYRNG